MEKKIEIRIYHVINIEWMQRLRINPLNNYLSLDPEYKVGTSADREVFLAAITQSYEAVMMGNFTPIKEGVDFICDVCLNPECLEMPRLNQDLKTRQKRYRLLERIRKELKKEGSFSSVEERHNFICGLVDECMEKWR